MALIDKASLLMVPSTYEDGTLYNVLPSGNKAPDETGNHNGYDQTRADFTFSRGSNLAATRVNANGLIEKGRENLLTYSNDFSNAAWTKVNATLTSGQTGYDGTNNAWKISSSASGSSQIFIGGSNTNLKTHSIYAKAGSVDVLKIWVGSNKEFNLSNGTTSSSNSKITDVGNGWFRCEVFDVFSNYNPFFTATTAGDYIYIQDAQLEQGLVATDYIETGATTATAGVLENTPRIDYSSGAGALLLEPQRTNLVPHSEYFASSDYTKVNIQATSNQSVSPEGLLNASLLANTDSVGAIDYYDTFTAVNGGTYTLSCFAKSNGFTKAVLRFYSAQSGGAAVDVPAVTYDLNSGEVITEYGLVINSDIEDYGNGWYRLILTANSVSTSGYFSILPLSDSATWNASYNYPSNLGSLSDIQIFGYQVEAGSYPTSYIPNHGESGGVTRAADSCSVTGVSDVIGQTEGTLFVEFITPETNSYFIHAISNGTNDNKVQIEYNTTTDTLIGIVRVGGVTIVSIPATGMTPNTRYKAAIAYKANDFVFYVNGTQEGTDTSGSVPSSMSAIHLGSQVGTFFESGEVYNATLFNERLSNTELATLTTL